MANSDRPNGFTPIGMLDGSKIPVEIAAINSAGSNIFIGDVVSVKSGGDLDAATADDANIVYGVVVGIVDENKVPAGHPNSTISTKYLPSGDTGFLLVALALPGAKFRVQASTGTALAATDRFACANHVAGTGSTTTGRSGHELNSTVVTGSAAQCCILDKVDEPGNDWGAHVDLVVTFNESYFVGGVNGV